MKIMTLNGPRGVFFQPEEVHSYCEVLIRKEDMGILTVEDQEYSVSAGDIAMIPAGLRHSDRALETYDLCHGQLASDWLSPAPRPGPSL